MEGCREDRTRATAVGFAEEDGSLGAGRVEHRTHVIERRLDVGESTDPIREAGPPLVEPDHPGERRKPPQETSGRRILPEHLQLGGESRDPQEVLVAVAELLVREIGPVTRLRVSGLGDHARSLSVRARISEGSGYSLERGR